MIMYCWLVNDQAAIIYCTSNAQMIRQHVIIEPYRTL